MKYVTCFYDGLTGEFNHIAMGYSPRTLAPLPKSEQQRKAWYSKCWIARPGLLIDGVVHEITPAQWHARQYRNENPGPVRWL